MTVDVCPFFFFKKKTAYEVRPRGWSSDVCSSDLVVFVEHAFSPSTVAARMTAAGRPPVTSAIAAGVLAFGDAHGPGNAYGEMMTTCLAGARARGISLKAAATE